jgi:outer membrane protein
MIRSSRTPSVGGSSLVLAAGLIVVLTSVAAAAPGVSVSTQPAAELQAASLRGTGDTLPLTLDEAVAIALNRNLGLVIERYSLRQLGLGLEGAYGIYDLNATASTAYGETNSRASSELQGSGGTQTTKTASFNLGINQLVPTGGRVDVGFTNGYSDTNDRFASFNPSYRSGFGVTFTQPLLSGRGRLTTERSIILARLSERASQHGFEVAVTRLIEQVENAYWDVVETRSQLKVAEESLALAQELDRRNRIQVEVGTLAPLELVQSEATVATRQEDIIRANTNVGNAADRLRQLLNLDQGSAWDQEIVPETDPATPRVSVTLAEAIRTALAERPEIARQTTELERLGVNVKLAEAGLLPRLDLVLDYGLSGVGGDRFRVDFTSGTRELIEEGGYSDAVDQIKDGDFDDWSVRLNFAYPLQNRAARADRAIAEIDVQRAKATMAELEQSVITEVRTAVRGVEAAWQQIQSAGVSRRLQERNLEAEQKRYENGMSTSFQVTQIQEDLTFAKSREVTAIASYRRALASYYRAVGRLLDETGVELQGGIADASP